ncbi:MAG: T9SS type A sorting domain-containing protein [Candidatus Cloacimonetes bacterium]|nr:T9SS type A sorting domain-containing protein [Candidatus Cloacimonadota bacterium]
MKALFSIMMVALIVSALLTDEAIKVKMAEQSPFSSSHSSSRDLIPIFEEDFETGAEDWEHYDETSPEDWQESWHLSTAGAYMGNSWWMGDEELGGYTDERYLVLDTPEITLAEEYPALNFMFSLCCEDIGGVVYDGWDGANVRISSDGGNTWEVISGTPAYNASSLYSFGYSFNEGEGIPGWGSTTNWVNWTQATFDLSAHAGENVKIRFAFASDVAYNTADDENMFGFRIDNIFIDTSEGIFTSDGDGAAGDMQMLPGYGCHIGGELWHIYEDSEAPSPSHAMGCFDEEINTYLPYMSDFIITPEFYLPAGGTFYWDVYFQARLDEPITYPEFDYMLVEISSQIPGEDWSPWSIPYTWDNYFFIGNFDDWTLFSEAWGEHYCDLSYFAGRNVKMRFGLHSNSTDEPVSGRFCIDDFCVLQEVFAGQPPANLVAITNIDNQVELTWDAVIEGGEEGWLQWDDGINDDATGLTIGGTFYVAISFDPIDIIAYTGGDITELEVYINDVPSAMTVYVWEGDLATTELISQDFTPEAESWNTIILDTPVTIESNTEYWIGYSVTHEAGQHPVGHDDGPKEVGKGDWTALTPGDWQSVSGFYGFNWNIHAYVEADGRRFPLFRDTFRERELTGYNIWHSTVSGEDYQNIGTIEPIETPYFLDENPVEGIWNFYTVTALYDGQDGEPSNEAMAYIMSIDDHEIAYDDGTCEEGINVGIAQYMAVRFISTYPVDIILTHVKFYIETLNYGQFVFRILEDDAGFPGAQIAQFSITPDDLHIGWNTIEIPGSLWPLYLEGSFFISIFEMAHLSAIGKDIDTSGNSWITAGTENVWEQVTDGNLMIRAFIIYLPGTEHAELIPANSVFNAYPNPFNPETTITYQLAAAERVKFDVYNVRGQKVSVLLDEIQDTGQHSFSWNAEGLTSGIYYIRMTSGAVMENRKIVLIK